ncbi:MAG: alpha-L-rhamnosidase N-terminal domain-containing protein, partial [Erysipelotrichaceae bacterium]|nr:alpha-L-rhamnosidase N-terminal domain-containing protein [Erysipelotrichaceae bacterium]
MKWNAKWIKPVQEHQDIAPVFLRKFSVKKELKHAELKCTVLGVYEARMNGKRIGDFYMAPGWTAYDHRLQVQSYDVTSLIEEENHLTILTGKGWYRNPLADWARKYQREMMKFPAACTAVLTLTYMDGSQEIIETDQQWTCADSQVLFSELY